MSCPLCNSSSTPIFHTDNSTKYYRCSDCELIFLSKKSILSFDEERGRYASHNNVSSDPRYIKYLTKTVDFVEPHRDSNSKILDFGSGKNAVLEYVYKNRGIKIDSYDPMYGIGLSLEKKSYDIVILCEVIEHLINPKKELEFINSLLKTDGMIFIRTSIFNDSMDFATWWYRKDPTHIIFFSNRTIEKIRELFPELNIFLIA